MNLETNKFRDLCKIGFMGCLFEKVPVKKFIMSLYPSPTAKQKT